MMMNLFSMFDPANFSFKFAWIYPSLFILLPSLMNYSKHNLFLKKAINLIKKEILSTTNSNLSNNSLIPMFFLIFLLNLISMTPSSFSITSNMSFVFPLALSMWLSSMMYFTIKKTNSMLTHLTPTGTPPLLIPIMVMIEVISNTIRPITLSVRLMANITAGHLMMHLLSSFICNLYPSIPFFTLIPISMILLILEMSMTFIQSYIMTTLISMYSSEIH